MYILFEDRQSFQFMIYFSELVHQFVFYIIFLFIQGQCWPQLGSREPGREHVGRRELQAQSTSKSIYIHILYTFRV